MIKLSGKRQLPCMEGLNLKSQICKECLMKEYGPFLTVDGIISKKMVYKAIINSHKKRGKDKGKYLSLCCMCINFYWDDIKGYDCTHKIPLIQIYDMFQIIGKEIYHFLEKIISHEAFIVLPGLNKNHGLTQKWLEIAFMREKKTKKELDELLYVWGDLKRTYENKLTKKY